MNNSSILRRPDDWWAYSWTFNVYLIKNLMTFEPTEMEFDLDKALEDVPIHVEDTSSRTPPTPSQVLPKLEHRQPGGMAELPSEEEKKLQHFTKLRPRRNKKTHSSKVPVSQALQAEHLVAPKRLPFIYLKIEITRKDCNRTWVDYIPITHMLHTLTLQPRSSFSKSTALHLRMGNRMASWEGWMRVWTSSSLQKSPRWIQSKNYALFEYFYSIQIYIYDKGCMLRYLLYS